MRRSARGADAAPSSTDIEGITEWLLRDAINEDDLLLLFESLAWRFVAAGLPFARSSLHVGTLHPQLIGFGWYWNSRDGICDEFKVHSEVRASDSYRLSPLVPVLEKGEHFRCNMSDQARMKTFPLMAELAQEGITDYLALPLRAGGPYHNAATIATRRKGGFSDADIAAIENVMRLFALHVERHIQQRIACNLMDTYLGHLAGEKVLHGAIKRGSGEPVDAVIWYSDMRGFTSLSDHLSGADVTALLNAYFEIQAGAVMAHGGEVLKFIGDGMLAVFPFTSLETSKIAAQNAVIAARDVMRGLKLLNDDPPDDLARIEGWKPLECGIALHAGEAFFGNVGAPERLDFTVTGRAVNVAARLEALAKHLKHSLLLTDEVAALLSCPLDDLGRHRLRGLSHDIAVFSPQEQR